MKKKGSYIHDGTKKRFHSPTCKLQSKSVRIFRGIFSKDFERSCHCRWDKRTLDITGTKQNHCKFKFKIPVCDGKSKIRRSQWKSLVGIIRAAAGEVHTKRNDWPPPHF